MAQVTVHDVPAGRVERARPPTGRATTGVPAEGAPQPAAVDLRSAAAALYGDLRLSCILTRLLDQSGGLLGVRAGSISLVDAARARYVKTAERGAACQVGRSFPLDEGITGRVAEDRGPVVLARYSDLRAGHLPAAHPAARGAVVAVPIWWRGEVLGANVAFAGEHRRFSSEEVDRFEVLSQVGAAGIASAAAGDPALSVLLSSSTREHAPDRAALVVTEVGSPRQRDAETSFLARELVRLVGNDVRVRQPGARLRVVLLHQQDRLRVLLHDEGGALWPGATPAAADLLQDLQRRWSAAVSHRAGTVHVERVPGWGVLVLADLPHAAGASAVSPLSLRERQVLALLARGLTDRQIAEELVIARKTVEKHVGSVLRKTGTASRTAAVVRACEDGWLPSIGRAPAG